MSDGVDLKQKILDAERLCGERNIPKFLGFLSETEGFEARGYLKNSEFTYGFFGGYTDAERTVLGIFPHWCEMSETLYPVEALTFTYNKDFSLSHRDFLGALMALGIKRETVGDILVGEGRTVVFFLKSIADFVISSIDKVGSVRVTVENKVLGELPVTKGFEEKSDTVASLRLDCVLAAICRKSRSGAAELIERSAVAVNSELCTKPTRLISNGDKISIRGVGRFIIDSASEYSKKGRIILNWRRYL